MSSIKGERAEILGELEAARDAVLEAFRDAPPEVFARSHEGSPSMRDIAWSAGLREDWTRRAVALGLDGRVVEAYQTRPRPAIAETPEYLAEWLEQCRRPTLALLRRLTDDDLGRMIALPEGEPRPARALLCDIARHDREHAAGIRALREESRAHDGNQEAP